MTARAIHVMVVNHQEAFLRIMRIILEGEGYQTTVCAASEGALQAAVTTQPDVIVVDTWLQTRDEGWEFIQNLRLAPETRGIPIIIASSDIERLKDYAAEVSALRNVLLIPKPFDEQTLLRGVKRITSPESTWDTDAQAAIDEPDNISRARRD
jgi:CheY-like chemotaxis protein